ncbi:hypothetical protein U3516DRAFT_773958 [Neocallimastix sp. 'constans']
MDKSFHLTRVRFPVNAFAFMAQSAEHPPRLVSYLENSSKLNKAHWSSSMILALGARAPLRGYSPLYYLGLIQLLFSISYHMLYLSRLERGANNAKHNKSKIARLAQSVERETLNLKVVESVALLAQLVERAAFNRKLLWRNWLARSAVNREVGGSSPPRSSSIIKDKSYFNMANCKLKCINTRSTI